MWHAKSGKYRILNEQDHLMIGESDVMIATLAFDPHGRRIVSGAFSNTLRLWDIDRKKSRHLGSAWGLREFGCLLP